MRKCKKCGGTVPCWVTLDGRKRNLANRKFCLTCSPFGQGNRKAVLPEYKILDETPHIRECSRHGVGEFIRENNDTRWRCEKCRKEAGVQSRVKRNIKKQKAIEYKGGACIICGYNKCIDSLEFHHENPIEKEIEISLALSRSWDRLKIELNKCVLVCRNCHGEIHFTLRNQ